MSRPGAFVFFFLQLQQEVKKDFNELESYFFLPFLGVRLTGFTRI